MSWKFGIGEKVRFGNCAGVVVSRIESARGCEYVLADGAKNFVVGESRVRAAETLADDWAAIQAGFVNPIPCKWKYSLSEPIALSLSGERGIVAGRCEYDDGSLRYYVRYLRRTQGGDTQGEGWFTATELVAQNCVLITTQQIVYDEFWQKIFARWEQGGRKPLTDEDVKSIQQSAV